MPFTLAHPAAALPLRRRLGRFGVPSALAIGSIAPDLAYFVPVGVSGQASHSLLGLPWFCLPMGLAAWYTYRVLFGPFALALAPAALAERIGLPDDRLPMTKALLGPLAVSTLVGAGTHVVWDSFTHQHGVAVAAFPALETQVHLLGSYRPAVFTMLQHASTLLGLGALVFWGTKRFRGSTTRRSTPYPRLGTRRRVFLLAAVMVPAVAVALAVFVSHLQAAPSTLRAVQLGLGRSVFAGGSALLLALTAAAALWHVKWRETRWEELPNEALQQPKRG
jgi:hypothetical protein